LAPVDGARASRRPIPEYLPERTFYEIDSREIRVEFPNVANKHASLEATRFLLEFCPGRVSKRFSIRRGERGYWPMISTALNGAPGFKLDVADVAPECTFVRELNGIPIYEPHSVRLVERPPSIKDSSHGSWFRAFHAEATGPGTDVPVLQYGPLGQIFSRKRAHLHRDNDGIRTLRYATGGEYEVLGDSNLVIRGAFSLEGRQPDGTSSGPQGIGFERQTDGIIFEVRKEHVASTPILPQSLLDRFKTDYGLQYLLSSEDLRVRANDFAISYLWQTSLAMLSATALSQRCTLQQAQALLRGRRRAAADSVIGRLLGGADDDDRQSGLTPTRRHQEILALWDDPIVQREIEAAEALLWTPISVAGNVWFRRRYVATLAEAINVAVLSLLPDVPEDDVSVDMLETPENLSIVVSENTGGGLGHIEAALSVISNDPARFDVALRAALIQCRRAREADTVLDLLGLARRGINRQALTEVFASIRTARSFGQIEVAKAGLREALRNCGLDASRDSISEIMALVLRPGSTTQTDRWLSGLNCSWRRKSAELGIAVPSAVFAYWCSRTDSVARRFKASLTRVATQAPSDQQVFLGLEGLLLEGCHDSCSECLGTGLAFDPETKPSRSLALHWAGLSQEEAPLKFGSEEWLISAREALRDKGRVTLSVGPGEMDACVLAMGDLLAAPIEADYLMVSASLTEVRRKGREWIFVWQARGLAGGT
jgi:hypothetical protein